MIEKFNEIFKEGSVKEITEFFKEVFRENEKIDKSGDAWPGRGLGLFCALTDLFVFERDYLGKELTFEKYMEFVSLKSQDNETIDVISVKSLDYMNFVYLYTKEKYIMSNLSIYLKAIPGSPVRKDYELFCSSGYMGHFFICGALLRILKIIAEKE